MLSRYRAALQASLPAIYEVMDWRGVWNSVLFYNQKNQEDKIMTTPMDAVLAIHNAFRRDMAIVDAAALDSARGKPGLAPTVERFRFLNEILVWHAHGEELAIFPALEAVAPLVAEAYITDHHYLDAAFETMDEAVAAQDALETARASAAFKFHLDLHLAKEDAHVYRLIRERVSLPDQGKLAGMMSSTVPQERFPDVIAWMFPLMSHTDRENMTRIWQMVMPAPVFAGASQLIHKAIGDDWAELTRRVPGLE
jgi:Hemerythrin HHE cation binding domain